MSDEATDLVQRADAGDSDALGELLMFYACGDITYVGGSMGNQGGHNALEPAALGKPVLMGPNMSNAKEIAAGLQQAGAAFEVSNADSFRQTVVKLLQDRDLLRSAGAAGQALVAGNKGALSSTMKAIDRVLFGD